MNLIVLIHLCDVGVLVIGCTGAVPHGLAFEHPEHSPAWNRCYTGDKTAQ